MGKVLQDAFRASGFSINEEKTRIMMSYERQEVTGLIVNRSANVWRRDISRMRMILHSAKSHGAEAAAKIWVGGDKGASDYWSYVCGWLSYFAQVRGKDDAVVAKLCKLAVLAGLDSPEWIVRSADMVREFDVFLSHASEDKPKVRRLKERLEDLGVSVFFDEDSIVWGDSLVDRINHGLLKSDFLFRSYLKPSRGRVGQIRN